MAYHQECGAALDRDLIGKQYPRKAIERGDRHVITTALKSGKVKIKKMNPNRWTTLTRHLAD
jgi:hypothetical protein